MNKTVNINLGGMFFHIDEDAYQKLQRYFDAIKRSLSNSNGQEEIIKDIEMRIAELISEKHTSDKQVISLKELDDIITIMGQPEDYRIDYDDDEPRDNFKTTNRISKKLYRDNEKASIAGVCAGLGHYFGIDSIWIKISFLILAFTSFGIFAYIILWIVMPEAITTAEKLEMTGQPITISSIEKKVREEFDSVSQKIKNANYDKMGNQVKSGMVKSAEGIGELLHSILKIIAKVIGVILILISLLILMGLFIGIFTLGTTTFIDFPWTDFINAGNFSDYPIWFFGILVFLAVGIPFFFILLLGFKLLSPATKSIGNIAKYTILALWIIAIGILISFGIKQASEFAADGRIIHREEIILKTGDTLLLKFKHNDYYSKNINEHSVFMISQDSSNNNVIYSNQVQLRILKTDEKTPYIQIVREAKGKSISEARKTSERIIYGYKIIDNQILLDNYLITDYKNKFRNQKIEILLYLPEGTLFKPDASIQEYDNSDDAYFNLHFSSDNYIYQVTKENVKCLNCPLEENEWNDVENKKESDLSSSNIIINDDEISFNNKKDSSNDKIKSIVINKDGVSIKKY